MLWLALVAVLGGLGWAGLSACGFGWGGGVLSFCPAEAEPIDAPDTRLLTEEIARTRQLERDLDALRLALLDQPPCPPPPRRTAALPEPPAPAPEPAEIPPPTAPVPARRPTPPPVPEPPVQVAEAPAPPVEAPRVPDEFDQRVARDGGREGEVQVTLIWDNVNDLDVHVYCPNGSRIYYASMHGCGGALDIDANAGGGRTRSPVENVTWPGGAPPGQYRVEIDHYANHGGPEPTPYRVRIRVGEEERIITGILAPGQPRRVITFQVP